MEHFQLIEKKLDSLSALLQNINFTGQKEMFNPDDASVYLGISKSTLYKHTSSGNIAYYKPNGKLILFNKTDLDTWLLSNRIPANHEL